MEEREGEDPGEEQRGGGERKREKRRGGVVDINTAITMWAGSDINLSIIYPFNCIIEQ